MAWDGALNLRDLGGLPLVGGGSTVPGRVFRSGAPEWMTSLGWTQAAAAGLTRRVDLRNTDEIGRHPHHPSVPGSDTVFLDVVNAPTENPDDAEFMEVCGPWLDHPRSFADTLRFYPGKFAAVFRAIAEADGAVLVHCSGGKDRTGLVTAMLLTLTGVERTAVLDDYVAAFRTANAHQVAHPELSRHFADSPELLDDWVTERRAALDAFLDDINVVDYLVAAGLDEATLARLREKLA